MIQAQSHVNALKRKNNVSLMVAVIVNGMQLMTNVVHLEPHYSQHQSQHLNQQRLNQQRLNQQRLNQQRLNQQRLNQQHLNQQHLNQQHPNRQHLHYSVAIESAEAIHYETYGLYLHYFQTQP